MDTKAKLVWLVGNTEETWLLTEDEHGNKQTLLLSVDHLRALLGDCEQKLSWRS